MTKMITMIAMMIIITSKFFTEKIMPSAEIDNVRKFLWILLNLAQFLQGSTYDCVFQINSPLCPSMNKSVSYFSLKKIWFMGKEVTHKNDTRNTLLSSNDSWCFFWTCFSVFENAYFDLIQVCHFICVKECAWSVDWLGWINSLKCD